MLPVHKLAAENCILFLWVTFPMLPEGLQVINAWGFEYKTVAFNWVKTNPKKDSLFWGMGNWTRSNSEVCLLAITGKPTRESASVLSAIVCPRLKHSQKPPEIRDRIVKLCGDVRRIELFATEKAEGWDAIGFEVDGKDIRDVLFGMF